jgi:SAM-dependent methyltransferase
MPTRELIVAPGNEQQARAWDRDEGETWARYPEFFESSVRQHQATLLEAAALTTEARVLDIGRGTADSTRDAAQAAQRGAAMGIDLSSRMLERARARAAAQDLTNATFVQGDAQIYPSNRDRSMSRSAEPARCSSPTRLRPSPTSRAPCKPTGAWRWCRGRARSATNGSGRSSMR